MFHHPLWPTDRVVEVVATAAVSLLTTVGIGLTMNTDLPAFLLWAIPIGVSALVGYFTAQITVRAELASLRATMDAGFGEMRRYYAVKSREDRDNA